MKRVLAYCLGVLAIAVGSFAVTSSAVADDVGPNGEVAATDMSLTAQKGSLYQGGAVPANWSLDVGITQPWSSGDVKNIMPLKNIRAKMPTDLTFNPDPKMPVCGPDKIGPPPINMSVTPQTVIARCPKSVIGNGTADLYLYHKNTTGKPSLSKADDTPAVLIVFNGGRNAQGRPVIKIYGYSKATSAGIYMESPLEADGTLSVDVPRLTGDAGVGRFDLNIPGSTPIRYNYKSVPESVGQDRNYAQAKCSTGSWTVDTEFTLGYRDPNGNPSDSSSGIIVPPAQPDPNVLLDSPRLTLPCVGKPGKPAPAKAKIGKVTVKGAGKAKRGKKVTYRVTVRNTGGAAAKGVKVVAKGKGAKGSANGGTIAAGKSKTVKVKVKFTKKGKSKVTFTAKSRNGGSKKAVKRVTVK